MQQPTPRPEPMYSGAMTDENIRSIFQGAGDFIARELMCSGLRLYAYMIDGLVSGSDASEYIVRPISEHLQGQTMEELYDLALGGQVYNSVADPCQDLDTVAKKLVNGFCVVLFPGVGAIAFEVKTGEKRGLSAPRIPSRGRRTPSPRRCGPTPASSGGTCARRSCGCMRPWWGGGALPM